MCAASSLPRVRSAAVTWITRCFLLTFDEFERVMRTVKKCFGNTKTLGNNVLKLRTLLMTRGINIGYCICVSARCNKTAAR